MRIILVLSSIFLLEFLGRVVIFILSKSVSIVSLAPFAYNIGFLREMLKRDERIFSKYDNYLGFSLNPGLIEYAPIEIGRSKEITYKIREICGIGVRDEIESDIYGVAVGDSYTFCYGVEEEDCWTEILQNMLGKNILNAGVPGYGTEQEYLFLKKIFECMPDIKPRYVFVVVNFTDYLDDDCFETRENCNIFSPTTVFLEEGGISKIISYSVIAGFIKTLIDIPRVKKKYKELGEPRFEALLKIKNLCKNKGCIPIVVFAYNVPMKTKICGEFICIKPNFSEDMFMGLHYNELGNKFLAETILKKLEILESEKKID